MSAFDATVRPLGFGVHVPDEEPKVEAQLAVQIAALIPVGPNQAAPLPLGQVRFPINRDGVKQLIDALTEAYNNMDDPPRESDLIVPGSPDAAEQAAQQLQQFRG